MNANVGGIDSVIRILTGVLLLSLVFLLDSNMRWVGLIGVVPLVTGMTRRCILYIPFGIDTREHKLAWHSAVSENGPKRTALTDLSGGKEGAMNNATPDFSLQVEGVTGACPAGEVYAKQNMSDKKIPVFSCEGPCIRGDIARLAANLVAQEVPSYARACHAETFFVPHSSMAHWVQGAEKSIMIDGCFLKCHGRVLKKLVGEDKVTHIDALPLYKKYNDVFLMDDVPEDERKAVARQVADKIMAALKDEVRAA